MVCGSCPARGPCPLACAWHRRCCLARPGSAWRWSGSDLLLGGGGCCDQARTVDVAAYNPASDPRGRLPVPPFTPWGTAARTWAGSEMVVAGDLASPDGTQHDASPATDGAVWNPTTGMWRPIDP